MDKRIHLTTDTLILFMDRELDQAASASAQRHLLLCVECAKRLQVLENGSRAYDHYHEEVLKPGLRIPTSGWAPFSDRLQPERRIRWGIWCAAAVAAALVLVWPYLPIRRELGAQEVLEKAEATPEQHSGEILFTTRQHRFVRPAVLDSEHSDFRFQHAQALFVASGYSWSNPLSARSFANWRRHLSEKRDFVTAIHEENGRRFYRVRTHSDSGVLRSASLTMEAVTYHATRASFEFQGEDLIELSEQRFLPRNGPQQAQPLPPAIRPKMTETVAGPEDELRVFSALDAIGADVEEPIDVKLDAKLHSVLVTGMGMPNDRRKQIEAALASLPNTVVRFSSGQPLRNTTDLANEAAPIAENSNSAFRQKLQERAGGARQLQTITDETLETSNSLFAQSHSLLVLAQEFPPAVEAALSPHGANSLLALRQRHLGVMSYALRRLRDQLRPLMTEEAPITEAAKSASWQSQAESLYESTRNLDQLVSRLLAGSYHEQAGERMLKEMPDDISKVETLVVANSR
jgi:hypothetical protein